MGYQRQTKTYVLKFGEDTGEYAGLVVKLKSPKIKVMQNLIKDALTLGSLTPDQLATRATEGDEDLDRIYKTFADHLVEWNLEDEDGEAVPATFEGVCEVDQDLFTFLLDQWIKASAGVSAPLDKPASSGETFPDLSEIPTVPLSSNLAS